MSAPVRSPGHGEPSEVGSGRSADARPALSQWGPWVLLLTLSAGAGLRIWLSFHDAGIYWPDEIYQGLEPAHRLVFGYGLIPWEFIQGARNWTFSALLAGLLKASILFGAREPRQYLSVVRLAFSAIGVATAWGSYRLARSYGASAFSAACGAATFALAAPAIYFAPRAMTETASALAIAFGLALGLVAKPSRVAVWSSASLLGFAVLLRLQNGIFCLGYLAILLARKRWRHGFEASVVLLSWAVLYGLMDKLTWGRWFQSALVYLRFNLIEDQGSAIWGRSPFDYYIAVLWRSMPLIVLVALPLAMLAWPRARGLLLTTFSFLLLHSLVPHKEYRFLLPALPLLCALAAIGLEYARRALSPVAANVLGVALLVASAASAANFRGLTFGDLGQYLDLKPGASAYDDFGPLNRLLLAAHQQADLCGLKVESVHLAWTGGQTYLHRRAPLYAATGPSRSSGFFNYVLTTMGSEGGAAVIAREGPFVLVRLPHAGCIADPSYTWRLP